MALASELMALSIPSAAAAVLGFDTPVSALTATGSTQGTALALTSSVSIFGTVAASTGAILPTSRVDRFIYNGGANALTVYPPVGWNFCGLTANTGISVPVNKGARFTPLGLQIMPIISA